MLPQTWSHGHRLNFVVVDLLDVVDLVDRLGRLSRPSGDLVITILISSTIIGVSLRKTPVK